MRPINQLWEFKFLYEFSSKWGTFTFFYGQRIAPIKRANFKSLIR